MNKKVKGIVILLIMAIGLVINFIMPVTAEGSTNILNGKEWKYSFTNDAHGTFTSTSSNSFVVDMSTIGNGEWATHVSTGDISLEAGENYIFEANIKSDKDRIKNFVSICSDENSCDQYTATCLNGASSLVDFIKNKMIKYRIVINPSTNFSNASVHFGFGKNGYEGTSVLPTLSNKIEVSDVKLTKLSDYSWMSKDPDYTSYNYTPIVVSDEYVHKNYSYSGVENINYATPETKTFGESLAVATTAGNVKKIDGIYQVYINGELVGTNEAAAGWYHIDYDNLDREYNEVWTLSEVNSFSILIVKNGNVTNAKAQILEDLDTNYRIPHQDSSDAVKQIIEDAALEITNAQTVAEAQAIYDAVGNKITLQEHKETRSQDVSEAGENTNEEIEAIVAQAISDIAEATSIAAVDSIADTAIETIEAKKEEIVNAKTAATAEIDELIGENPSIAVTTLANTAKSAINDATSVDAVNRILNEAKNSITLQKTKESAIAEIDELIGENPSDVVKTIADKAIAAINRSESKEEVQSILEKALKDIKAQQDSENQKEGSNDNPVTLDNILKYFLVLFIGTIGLLTLNNKKVLKRSR